jgi:hypothetical protein
MAYQCRVLLGAESAGDLLLGLGRSQVGLGLVVRGWDPQVMGETQDIVGAIAPGSH